MMADAMSLLPVLADRVGDDKKMAAALKRAGVPAWSGLPGGTDDDTFGRIDDHPMVIIVVSTDRALPDGVKDAITHAKNGGKRLVPVLIDGVDAPPALQRRIAIKVGGTDPFARAAQSIDHARKQLAQTRSPAFQDLVVEAAVVDLDAAPEEVKQARRDHLDALTSAVGVWPHKVPTPGLMLDERFVLCERVGRGGFAEVWRAWDVSAGDRGPPGYVAVKIMRPEFGEIPQYRRLLRRGADAMRGLNHRHVVEVRQAPKESRGWYYFVMEYLAGGDMQARVTRLSQEEVYPGRVARTRLKLLTCVVHVADALGSTHGEGLVHRDVKPANIVFGDDGHAKLTDFDLVMSDDSRGGSRTGRLGSVVYVAPEVLVDARSAKPQADVYSLGMCVAFVMLGPEMFPGIMRRPEQKLEQAVQEERMSGALRDVIEKALHEAPGERFRNGAAFARALRAALDAYPQMAGEQIEPADGRPALVYVSGTPPGQPFAMSGDDRTKTAHVRRTEPIEGLWMAITPVTVAQYRHVMMSPSDDLQADRVDRPMTSVRWVDAVRFCNALSTEEGLRSVYMIRGRRVQSNLNADGYRLPTEIEWEYACRAGGAWSPSVHELDRFAWHGGNAAGVEPVAALDPNPWGLYDMLGNVWEWCHDPYQKLSQPVSPMAQPSGSRVLRGGAWDERADEVRAAPRKARPIAVSPRSIPAGFRIVRRPDRPRR